MKCFVSYQVYIVRFKVECTDDGIDECSSPEDNSEQEESNPSPVNPGKAAAEEDTQYPASISIDVLLKAGQLLKPKRKKTGVTVSGKV